VTASDAALADCFGVAVDIDADRILIGANRADGASGESGAAYVFRCTEDEWGNPDWGEVGKLTAPDGAEHDFFGESVAIAGDFALGGLEGRHRRDRFRLGGLVCVDPGRENGAGLGSGPAYRTSAAG